ILFHATCCSLPTFAHARRRVGGFPKEDGLAVLEARRVRVDIPTADGVIHAVRDVSFEIEAGELFGIAGESGSGKSVLVQAMLGLLPGAQISGEVLFEGRDLLALPQRQMQAIRGSRISMIFQ